MQRGRGEMGRAVAPSGVAGVNAYSRNLSNSGPDDAERRRGALAVLRAARTVLAVEGWCQGAQSVIDSQGRRRWSLLGAVARSSVSPMGWEQEWARGELRIATGTYDLGRWNDSAVRRREGVLTAVDRAIGACGGTPPRRGGWRISRGGKQ